VRLTGCVTLVGTGIADAPRAGAHGRALGESFMNKLIGHLFGVDLPPLDEMLGQWAGSMGPWFYGLLFLVIFCETGLVVTPFLPGDSLLFAVGALASAAGSGLSMPLLLVLLIAAAVIGDAVNYAIGYRLGPKVFKYEQSRLFNKKHLLRAQEFYEKYGNKTIILARFVPIVRTFAPFVAGIGKMRYRRFFAYNVVGGAGWVLICVFAGRFFADFEFVKLHFESVIVAIVLISVLPMAVEFLLAWRRRRRGEPAPVDGRQNEHLNGTATKLEAAIKAPAAERR
jgi:membrane-associated protein